MDFTAGGRPSKFLQEFFNLLCFILPIYTGFLKCHLFPQSFLFHISDPEELLAMG